MLRRCGNRCEHRDGEFRCNNTATDVDHIVRGDLHLLENLQGLCSAHHKIKTAAEGHAARADLKKLARLPEEQQPGIIDGPPRPTEHRGF